MASGSTPGAYNAQSTAWAIQGMIAVGANPDSVKRSGKSGPDYLTGLQQADGHFRYSSSRDQTPVWVTGQALVAAAGQDFPVPVAPRAPKPAPTVSPAPAPAPAPAPQPTLPPVPIPGVTSSPATPAPSSNGGSGRRLGRRSQPRRPGDPRHPRAAPPIRGAGAITPPTVPGEGEEPRPGGLVEAQPASAVEPEYSGSASPWIPIGIGLGVGLLALVLPVVLGRRYAW